MPEKVKTVTFPVSVRYFSPKGFFAGLGGTYVDQEVRHAPSATQASGSDNFFLVDGSIGYRLPNVAASSVSISRIFSTRNSAIRMTATGSSGTSRLPDRIFQIAPLWQPRPSTFSWA